LVSRKKKNGGVDKGEYLSEDDGEGKMRKGKKVGQD